MGILICFFSMFIFMVFIWVGVRDMFDLNVYGLGLCLLLGCCFIICCFGWLGNKLFVVGFGGFILIYILKKLWRLILVFYKY